MPKRKYRLILDFDSEAKLKGFVKHFWLGVRIPRIWTGDDDSRVKVLKHFYLGKPIKRTKK